MQRAIEQCQGQRILHHPLDRALQRPRTEGRVVAVANQHFLRLGGQREAQLSRPEHRIQLDQLQIDDLRDLLLAQGPEDHDVIDAIEELRPELLAQHAQHLCFDQRPLLSVPFENHLAADVAGEDHDRVPEVDCPPLRIGEATVIEQLQQHIEDIRVRLLDLVEEQHGIGSATHRLGQLPSFIVADIAWWRTDQACDGVLLHVLRHVEAHHRALVVEQKISQRTRRFCLADTGWTEEEETADRTARILKARPGAPHRVRDRRHRVALADDTMRELLLEFRQACTFRLEHPLHRDTRPLCDHGSDVVITHFFLQEATPAVAHRHDRLRLRQLALKLRDPPILNLRRQLQVAAASRLFGISGGLIDRLLDATDIAQCLLFLLPLRLHGSALSLEFGQLAFERDEALTGGGVGLLLHRLPLDLELHHAPFDFIDRLRQRVDLDAQPAGGFIQQVDRLVRQKTVADVAVRQCGRRHDRTVRDPHAMMRFVPGLETTQNRDRVIQRRLGNHDGLEPAFECRVLLEVLAVLVERGGADHAEFASREHRLQHVAGVHRPFRLPGANEGVQFVDEHHDFALAVDDLL